MPKHYLHGIYHVHPTLVSYLASALSHSLSGAAQISHVMLRTDPAALGQRTKGECNELLTEWKGTIADDLERFARCARERSECVSKSRGGDLGFKTRAQMSKQFCDIAFVEEPGRVYGPIETKDSMHLMYLHSCRGGDDFKEDTSVSES